MAFKTGLRGKHPSSVCLFCDTHKISLEINKQREFEDQEYGPRELGVRSLILRGQANRGKSFILIYYCLH